MTIDILALARECGFEFYPDADGNVDDDLFTGSRNELIAFGNAIIERCAVKCDEHAANCKQKADKAWEVTNLQSIHASWTLEGIGATESAANIRSMKAPTP